MIEKNYTIAILLLFGVFFISCSKDDGDGEGFEKLDLIFSSDFEDTSGWEIDTVWLPAGIYPYSLSYPEDDRYWYIEDGVLSLNSFNYMILFDTVHGQPIKAYDQRSYAFKDLGEIKSSERYMLEMKTEFYQVFHAWGTNNNSPRNTYGSGGTEITVSLNGHLYSINGKSEQSGYPDQCNYIYKSSTVKIYLTPSMGVAKYKINDGNNKNDYCIKADIAESSGNYIKIEPIVNSQSDYGSASKWLSKFSIDHIRIYEVE